MGSTKKQLFKGTISNGNTEYVGIPVGEDSLTAIHIAWFDGTSSATVTLEHTLYDANEAPVDEAGSAWEWLDTGESITGPSGSSAGGEMVNLGNVAAHRMRLKIIAAADCDMEILGRRKGQ